ncbi:MULTISPECIES: DUF2461 domain-containing protein [Gordonia]|uniref:DUF2461 domain-containing protein n=1 Tax=Gordonia cholesterolivorans TaxID=559625 RepID=A0ABN3HGV2_9ACTN|nr:DUF2461 domain-containing protein [Gordonia sihwensis]KJR05732.1 hypothetical protein UG54_15625 [Gordonia sihwensis]
MSFTGFPEAALDFYDDLEIDNSKVFWEAHRDVYQSSVAAPMVALTDELADEFGPAKVFRPYRDVRFSKDKTPYKTHQGAFVAVGPATGYYVQISAPGVRVAAGFYHADPDTLAAIRRAIDDDLHGAELEKIVGTLERKGWEVGGDRVKTSPRGWSADHPRIDLLRYRSLTVSRDYGFDEVIHSPALVDRVRKDWRQTRPLVDWLVRRVG